MSNSLRPLDYSPPGSPIYGVLLARILEWVAFPFSQASLVAQLVKNLPAMQETWVWIPGLGRSPGLGSGYSVQYSGLENSIDCIVHGVSCTELDMTEQRALHRWQPLRVQATQELSAEVPHFTESPLILIGWAAFSNMPTGMLEPKLGWHVSSPWDCIVADLTIITSVL